MPHSPGDYPHFLRPQIPEKKPNLSREFHEFSRIGFFALPQKSLLRASLPLRKPVCLLPDMDWIGFRTPV
jgi:hypothetical protein